MHEIRFGCCGLEKRGSDTAILWVGMAFEQKPGLDAVRHKLLETALQAKGKKFYEEMEVEVLRLFRDLHVVDPLSRRSNPDGFTKNHIVNKFSSRQPRHPPSRGLLCGFQLTFHILISRVRAAIQTSTLSKPPACDG